MAQQSQTRSDDGAPEAGNRGLLPTAAAFSLRLGGAGLGLLGPCGRWLLVPAQPGAGTRGAGAGGAAAARARRGRIRAGRGGFGSAAARAEGGRRPVGRGRRGRGAGGAGRPAGRAQPADRRRLRAPLRDHRRQPGARSRAAAAVAGAAHGRPLPGDRARRPQLCRSGQRGALYALGVAGRADRPQCRGGAVRPHAAAATRGVRGTRIPGPTLPHPPDDDHRRQAHP
jgi:hypothetical protein